MRIYIPSHKRHDLLKGKTIWEFPPELRPRLSVVVYDDEADLYKPNLPENVELITSNAQGSARGIANKRRFISELARSRGEELFAMFDDDLGFFERIKTPRGIKEDNWRLIGMKPETYNIMLEDITHHLNNGYSAVGISSRILNNTVDKNYVENTRLMHAYGYRTKDYLENTHRELKVMEDFDTLLQLLRRGKPILSIYWCACSQADTQTPGGCSTYRTPKVQEEAAYMLKKLHPEFVRIVKKNLKGGGNLANRVDVEINWKKAFNFDNIRLI